MKPSHLVGLAVTLAGATAISVPWTRTPIVLIVSYGVAALGVIVLMRAGQISFGHAMYSCAGGYTVAALARLWPQCDALLLLAAGTAVAATAGAILGAFLSRYRGIFFGMLNLGLSMVLYAVIGKLYTVTGGTDGLRFEEPTLFGADLVRGDYELGIVLLGLTTAIAIGMFLQRFFGSCAGQVLAALKTNETRLEYVGLSARRALWEGYVLSAALAGFAGAYLCLLQGIVTPESGYWLRSGEYVFVAILGGAGHALGGFLGAAAFISIQLLAGAYLTGAWQMLLGITLIAVIWLAPTGIVGTYTNWVKQQENAWMP